VQMPLVGLQNQYSWVQIPSGAPKQSSVDGNLAEAKLLRYIVAAFPARPPFQAYRAMHVVIGPLEVASGDQVRLGK
jgi:hypothetical protein